MTNPEPLADRGPSRALSGSSQCRPKSAAMIAFRGTQSFEDSVANVARNRLLEVKARLADQGLVCNLRTTHL